MTCPAMKSSTAGRNIHLFLSLLRPTRVRQNDYQRKQRHVTSLRLFGEYNKPLRVKCTRMTQFPRSRRQEVSQNAERGSCWRCHRRLRPAVGHLSCHIRSLFPLIKASPPHCLCNSCHLAQDNGVMNNPPLVYPAVWLLLRALSEPRTTSLRRHWQTSCHLSLSERNRQTMIYNDGANERADGRKR